MNKFQIGRYCTFLVITVTLMLFSAFTFQQKVPAVNLKNLDGSKGANSSNFVNNGKPTILCFWATWAAPTKKELDEIAEVYEEWQKESGVKLIAISIDDARTSSKVKPTVEAKSWPYEIYLDEDADLQRAMNFRDVPQLFVLNANNEIVWQHNGYKEGDVEKLHNVISKVAKGEKPE